MARSRSTSAAASSRDAASKESSFSFLSFCSFHWTHARRALLGGKKYADAEPLLLAGYEGMKKQQAKIPPQGKVRLTEAVERLVQLYEAMDKKDDAAKWRKELEARKPQTPPK
ncbi:MAG: hypothetical protein ACYC6M_15285 [Terriglobales bacterium]